MLLRRIVFDAPPHLSQAQAAAQAAQAQAQAAASLSPSPVNGPRAMTPISFPVSSAGGTRIVLQNPAAAGGDGQGQGRVIYTFVPAQSIPASISDHVQHQQQQHQQQQPQQQQRLLSTSQIMTSQSHAPPVGVAAIIQPGIHRIDLVGSRVVTKKPGR